MAYEGYLFQFGNYKFPGKYILWDTFDTNPNQRQSIDSYTDGNGLTHINAVPHTKTQIQFSTRQMPENVMKKIMKGVTDNYINRLKRDANCKYFDTEYFTYKTGHFYLDPSFHTKIKGEDDDGSLLFNETQWLFIEL